MDKTLEIAQINNKLLKSCSYFIGSDNMLLIDPGEIKPIVEFIKNN